MLNMNQEEFDQELVAVNLAVARANQRRRQLRRVKLRKTVRIGGRSYAAGHKLNVAPHLYDALLASRAIDQPKAKKEKQREQQQQSQVSAPPVEPESSNSSTSPSPTRPAEQHSNQPKRKRRKRGKRS